VPPDPDQPAAAGEGSSRRQTILFSAVGALLAGALLFAIVARVTSTNATTSPRTDAAGNRVTQFDLGRAADFGPKIEKDGPLLFPDPQGKSRDIFIQFLGGTDWRAFEARAPGASRQCVLKWEQAGRRFVDPCTKTVYPADGAGLVTFPTTVNDKGRVIVDLGNPVAPATTTTAPAPAY